MWGEAARSRHGTQHVVYHIIGNPFPRPQLRVAENLPCCITHQNPSSQRARSQPDIRPGADGLDEAPNPREAHGAKVEARACTREHETAVAHPRRRSRIGGSRGLHKDGRAQRRGSGQGAAGSGQRADAGGRGRTREKGGKRTHDLVWASSVRKAGCNTASLHTAKHPHYIPESARTLCAVDEKREEGCERVVARATRHRWRTARRSSDGRQSGRTRRVELRTNVVFSTRADVRGVHADGDELEAQAGLSLKDWRQSDGSGKKERVWDTRLFSAFPSWMTRAERRRRCARVVLQRLLAAAEFLREISREVEMGERFIGVSVLRLNPRTGTVIRGSVVSYFEGFIDEVAVPKS
ncbi:hypothetical protein DFH06DRAFT_1302486 [Mycena polygramma]|nr:hypothetical protein DFH06DRAFT_1302486 [Mycena polygramma]